MPSEFRPRVLPRRDFFAAVAALACSRKEEPEAALQPALSSEAAPAPSASNAQLAPSSSASAPSGPLLAAEERTFEFPVTPVGPMSVAFFLPERHAGQKLPLLIALHGRGETLKGPARGARGWLDDYALARAASRLRRPPLTERDFLGFVESQRLSALNAALTKEPFEGVAVACPYLPDIFSEEDPFAGATPYANFLIDVLLPKLRGEFPLLTSVDATGIDGVSLGGRAAIAVGLARPDVFGAAGGLQPALAPRNTAELLRRSRAVLEKNPRFVLSLLTSQDDYYRLVVEALHGSLLRANIPHHFRVVPGPHDYAFNRGPGSLEMLVFHDRVLHGHAPF